MIAIIATALFLTKLHPALVLFITAFLGIILTKKELYQPVKFLKTKRLKLFLTVLILVVVCAGILFFFNKEYFTFATIMLRIDLFSFGGGLAAMPIMYNELVDIYGWFNEKTFMDGLILGQVTPGVNYYCSYFFWVYALWNCREYSGYHLRIHPLFSHSYGNYSIFR